jgi:hypothetical protein
MPRRVPPQSGPAVRGRLPGGRRGLVAAGVAAAVAVLATVASAMAWGLPGPPADRGPGQRVVTVRDDGGAVLARVPLSGTGFALQYRNSLYGTLAEERFAVGEDGRFDVVELAADQLAVLEEYYAVPGAPRRGDPLGRRAWTAEPDPRAHADTERLSIAATDLGQRTLLVPGSPPVPLWRLVEGPPTVVLHIEESS